MRTLVQIVTAIVVLIMASGCSTANQSDEVIPGRVLTQEGRSHGCGIAANRGDTLHAAPEGLGNF